MMSLQTGVNPEHLQAAWKARKKQKEKANGNHSPLKICAKVSPPFLASVPGCVLCMYTVCFVDSVNMQQVLAGFNRPLALKGSDWTLWALLRETL